MVSGRVGQSCASAAPVSASMARAAAARCSNRRDGSFTAFLPAPARIDAHDAQRLNHEAETSTDRILLATAEEGRRQRWRSHTEKSDPPLRGDAPFHRELGLQIVEVAID